MVRACDVGFVPAFHAAIQGSSFVRDTYSVPARHTPDLAKAWQEEFLNDGGGSFPKRSPMSPFPGQKHKVAWGAISGASTACPTPRSMTPMSHVGANELHSQWMEISAQQQRPQSARSRSAGGRSAQADRFEYRLSTPRVPSAQWAEEHADKTPFEFRAKTLGREYCGESWLQRIERRVDKTATPVTILDPQVQHEQQVLQSSLSRGQHDRGGAARRRFRESGIRTKEKDDEMPSDAMPATLSQQVAYVRKHTPRNVVRTRTQKKQMGSGRKAKLCEEDQAYADMTEALLQCRVAEKHIIQRSTKEHASRQFSVLHPAEPRYPDLTTESSQMGVEWTLTEDHSVSLTVGEEGSATDQICADPESYETLQRFGY